MLLIETYLAASSVHGVGLFTNAAIKAGTPVWQLIDEDPSVHVYTEAGWQNVTRVLKGESLKQLTRYTYKNGDRYFLLLDDSRFMNHSDEPNVGYHGDFDNDLEFALRDIMPGEELTCDYRKVCDIDFFDEVELEFILKKN